MKHPIQTSGAALALLAGSAAAVPTPQLGYEPAAVSPNAISWPASYGPAGDFKRIVTGEFAGNVMHGALALVGDRAVYLHEPAVHRDVTTVAASGVIDIAALEPDAPGMPAGMLLARADGLFVASLSTTAGTITTLEILDGNTDLEGLDLIRSGDLDGAGRQDVVGAKGSTVYVVKETGGAWVASPGFTAGGTVRDLVVLDWDGAAGDGLPDIAILLDQSVEIREADGDLIETQLGVASGGFLAHVPPTDSNSTERLAWSIPLPAPSLDHALLVLSYPGVRVNCGTVAETPASLGSALFDDGLNDTRIDLLTSRAGDPEVLVLKHRTASPPYVASSPNPVFDVGAVAISSDGPPAFGDVTLDGIPDTIAGRGAFDQFVVVPGAQPTLARKLLGPEGWGNPVLYQESTPTSGTHGAWLEVDVTMPSDLENHDKLQVVLWVSEDGTELEHDARANLWFDSLSPNQPVRVYVPLDFETAPPPTACTFTEGFGISARLVELNGDVVESASSPLHAVFALDGTTADNMVPPGTTGTLPLTSSPCTVQGSSTTQRIGFTPLPHLPPKRQDQSPTIPTIAEGNPPSN